MVQCLQHIYFISVLLFVAPALAQVTYACKFLSVYPSTFTLGLVSATPLTVFYRLFWNFACGFFMVWGYACGLNITVRSFLSLFLHCELSHFSFYLVRTTLHTILYQSFWNFAHNFSIVWKYNPCIIFVTFFSFVNFVIFWPRILWKYIDSGYLVITTPHTILYHCF